MAYIDFLSAIHKSTKRDYLARVNEHPKADAITRAKKYDFDYWDGDRKFGYGGFRYDGRWLKVAQALADHYKLKAGDRILDIGCGKGFLLYDLTQVVPGIEVKGIDISDYAVKNSKEEIRSRLQVGNAADLPFEDKSFDLVISINTIHNLPADECKQALGEIQRVTKKNAFITVDAYRDDEEKKRMFMWNLTAQTILSVDEWVELFNDAGYQGDYYWFIP